MPENSRAATAAKSNFANALDDDGNERCFVGVPNFVLVLMAIGILLLFLTLFPFIALLMTGSAKSSAAQGGQIHFGVEPLDSKTTDPKWPKMAALKSLGLDMELPPNMTKCDQFGFQCLDQASYYIGTNQRCDGISDCRDGSDEYGCTMCQTSFSCDLHNGKKKCLRAQHLCDGVAHCTDGSDENLELCRPRRCSEGEMQCSKSGTCIPESTRCDGERNCEHGEDEIGCTSCVNGAVFCKATSTCIPKWQICDGEVKCPDLIDEMNCTCTGCSGSGKSLCQFDGGDFCVLDKYICDGIVDCPNGEDEHRCPATQSWIAVNDTSESATVERVKCSDGRSYPKKYACSGRYDQCAESCAECDQELAFTCSTGTKKCIGREKVCDGVPDCSDRSDEVNCTAHSSATHFQCRSSIYGGEKFLRKEQQCDGYIDCVDGEDEENCDKCSRNQEAFYCAASRTCLASTSRCDGKPDCADHSDELNCSSAECSRHPFPTYLCKGESSQCFRSDYACAPSTQCSDPTEFDDAFCVSKARRSLLLERLGFRHV